METAGNSTAFTTDCWSEALMSLTAHFIDRNWSRRPCHGSHTGEYIGQIFLTTLEEWNIDMRCVVHVLRDSGVQMKKEMGLMVVSDPSCSAHTLQVIINDGLGSHRVLVGVLAKLTLRRS